MKLLDHVREVMRTERDSYRTEQCYVAWIEQFSRFHHGPDGSRHPADLDAADVERFLTHLAVERRVSASTQNQALNPSCSSTATHRFYCGVDLHAKRRSEVHPTWYRSSRGSYKLAFGANGFGGAALKSATCQVP